jgi:hypothetical protein
MVSGTAAQPATAGGGWLAGYRRRLVVTDVAIIVVVVLVSQLARFSGDSRLAVTWSDGLSYWTISALLAACWVLALALHSAWDAKSLGAGPTEFRRVATATCAVISCTAIVSFLTRLSLARGYLAIAFPLGLVGLLAGRWVWRLLLAEHRRAGTHLNSVLVVGGRVSAPALAGRLRSRPAAGYRVAGLCVPVRPPSRSTPFRWWAALTTSWELSRLRVRTPSRWRHRKSSAPTASAGWPGSWRGAAPSSSSPRR